MIIILRGVSGAGKDSTIAALPSLKHMVISSDDYRERWFGTRDLPPNATSMIWGKMKAELEERCLRGQNTIINATNCSLKSINGWTKIGLKYGHACHVISIDVPLHVLNERLEERRANGVFAKSPFSFVENMHRKFIEANTAIQKTFGDRHHMVDDCIEAALVISDLIANHNVITVDKKFEDNIFVIGDIHGEVEKLDELLSRHLPWDAMFYTLGDVIDRGPSSVGVLRRLSSEFRWRGAIRGNHESAFISERLQGAPCRSKARQNTHLEFDALKPKEQEKLTMLMATFTPFLRLEGEDKRILLTHAGSSLTRQSDLFRLSAFPVSGDHMLRIDDWEPEGASDSITHQVHGHSSWTYTGDFSGPVVNIDSGCGKTEEDESGSPRTLTAYNPFTGETITV